MSSWVSFISADIQKRMTFSALSSSKRIVVSESKSVIPVTTSTIRELISTTTLCDGATRVEAVFEQVQDNFTAKIDHYSWDTNIPSEIAWRMRSIGGFLPRTQAFSIPGCIINPDQCSRQWNFFTSSVKIETHSLPPVLPNPVFPHDEKYNDVVFWLGKSYGWDFFGKCPQQLEVCERLEEIPQQRSCFVLIPQMKLLYFPPAGVTSRDICADSFYGTDKTIKTGLAGRNVKKKAVLASISFVFADETYIDVTDYSQYLERMWGIFNHEGECRSIQIRKDT